MNKTVRFDLGKNLRFTILALTFVLFLLFPALVPEKASACACCANWGDWHEQKRPLSASERDIVHQIKLSAKPKVLESSGGQTAIVSTEDDFTLRLSRTPSKWTMALQNQKGEKGTLTLSVPQTATLFGTDPQDGKTGGGGGPLLYKEVRLEGRVIGTGIFAKGIKPDSRFRLILQGRGNHCMAVEDFNSWTLQINSRRIGFGFYGTTDKSPSR